MGKGSDDGGPLFTVLTVTFNRAHTLSRVRASLTAQSTRDFEWLVVDDGSTDDTAGLLARWQRDGPFPIRYVRRPHAGMNATVNAGVRMARGRFLVMLDSDDSCTPDALERLAAHWQEIPPEARNDFVGVTARCGDESGRRIGAALPASPLDSTTLDMAHRYKLAGERWGFQRVDVLRLYPFPEQVGADYIPMGIVWCEIGRRYRTRYVDEVLRVYHQSPIDGPSIIRCDVPASRHAPGVRAWALYQLTHCLDYLRHDPMAFAKAAALYTRASLHLRHDIREQRVRLQPAGKVLWLLMWPLGAFLYLRDRRQLARALAYQGAAAKGARHAGP